MPTPKPGQETQSEWMARCVPYLIDEGKDKDQAVAQCLNIWREANKGMGNMNKPITLPLEMQNERAYSVLTVKRVDQAQRRVEGIATTPTPDRLGDIVEPKGIEYKNPLPLLWQHNHDMPVGEVKFKKPTDHGIEFTAQLADPDKATSPTLKDELMRAWDSVNLGLVKGASIGFRPKEYNFMKDGGIRFEKTEVYEMSLVTIPANAEATILQIKSADMQAALGRTHKPITIRQDQPASGRIEVKTIIPASRGTASAKPVHEGKAMPRTIAAQLSAFERKRGENVARMQAIVAASDESGSTMEQKDKEEFDTLDTENATIEDHLVRLKKMEAMQIPNAIAVDGAAEAKKAGDPESKLIRMPVAKVKANVPPGTAFVRLAMALAAGRGELFRSLQYAKESIKNGGWSNTPEVLTVLEHGDDITGLVTKAAIGAGTTTDATWASPLVVYQVMAEEYVAILRPATIIGRIPGLRRVPFNIQIPVANAGTTVGWVGENAPKPVSNMQFGTITMRWAKAAGIVVITQELARFSNPAAEAIVRQDMVDQMVQFLDRQFVDPAVAAVVNVSPASITNGVTPVTATGTNQAAFVTDAKTLINTFLTQNLSTTGCVWIGTQQQAVALSLMLNALGQPFYPTMEGNGGTLLGYPYIASENVPATGGSPADGYALIFAKAPEIMLADDGQTVIDASNQASLQLDSTPDSPPTAATNLISLWQNNLTGIRAERWINWQKRRPTCVQFIQNAKYG
jgi:HK97 family phage major capsid protein/HK97 family phage prohead protease